MTKKPVCSIYEDIAEWFDSARNKSLLEKNNLDLVLARLPASPSILDLGCGTGEPIAKYLIRGGGKITGIDGSAKMISLCKERFPHHTWLQYDMRKLALNQTFDFLIAWDSFFHLGCDDQRKMFPIFANYVHKGGFLMFSSGSEENEDWDPMLGHEGTLMFHASLNSAEYRELLEAHDFEIVKHKVSDEECGGRSYWIAKKMRGRPGKKH